jgi:hypothetical protein
LGFDLCQKILKILTSYLSKFQVLMPEWVQREVVSTYLLDIDGAREWLLRRATGD